MPINSLNPSPLEAPELGVSSPLFPIGEETTSYGVQVLVPFLARPLSG
jgi:hypothetical protein